MSKSSKTKLPPIRLAGGIKSDMLTSISTSLENNKIIVELRLRLPKNTNVKVDNNNFKVEVIDKKPQTEVNNRQKTSKASAEQGRSLTKLPALDKNSNIRLSDKETKTPSSNRMDSGFLKKMTSLPPIQRHFRDPFPVETIAPIALDRTTKVIFASSELDETILMSPSKLPSIKAPKNNLNDAIRSKDVKKVEFAIKQGCRVTNLDYYPNMFSDINEDSLALAIRTKNPQIVNLILNHGAIISNDSVTEDNNRCYRHDTIFQAIQTGNEEIVGMVLKAGAKVINDAIWPGGESDNEYNSYTQAQKIGNKNIFNLVQEHGAIYAKKEGIMYSKHKAGPLDETVFTGHDNTTIIHEESNFDNNITVRVLDQTIKVDEPVSLDSVEVDISDIDMEESLSDESMNEDDLFNEKPQTNPRNSRNSRKLKESSNQTRR